MISIKRFPGRHFQMSAINPATGQHNASLAVAARSFWLHAATTVCADDRDSLESLGR